MTKEKLIREVKIDYNGTEITVKVFRTISIVKRTLSRSYKLEFFYRGMKVVSTFNDKNRIEEEICFICKKIDFKVLNKNSINRDVIG